MRKKLTKTLIITILIVSLSSIGLAQRQTGSIRGTVVDGEGTSLPGVTITITSPALMGTQSFVTGETGTYRFLACPPGEYTVKAELSGFQTVERPGVYVHVGLTVDANLIMKPATISEEITVTAPSPLVDTKNPKLSLSITGEMIKDVPMGREIYEAVKTAASVVDEGSASITHRKGVSIHGGTIYQSAYAIDGVNISDPYRGYITKDIAFDAIEEIEILTGAHAAEVGHVSAGYINVVSKSGGNKFSGSFLTQYSNESLQGTSVPPESIEAMGLAQPVIDKYSSDFSLSFGGPIIKDRVWFFLNPRLKKSARATPFIPFTDPQGVLHPAHDVDHKTTSGFFKLTAQLSQKIKYMGMFQYISMREDPCSVQLRPKRSYDANGYWIDDGMHISNLLTFLINQNTFAEARFSYISRHMEVNDIHERATGEPQSRYYDRYTGYYWNSYGFNEYYHRWKWTAELNFTRFVDNFLGGEHEFKAGVAYHKMQTISDPNHLMPYYQYWYNGTPWYYHNTTPYMGRLGASSRGLEQGMSEQVGQVWRFGFFVQDAFTVGKFSFNVGLRFDTTHVSRPDAIRKGWVDTFHNGLLNILAPEVFATEDQTAPAIKDLVVWSLLQPRIGFSYDIFGDGRTALKASFSRYSEAFTTVVMGGMYPFGGSATWNWYDDNHNGIFDLPPVDRYSATRIPRIITDPEEYKKKVDPNMSSPWVDEITTGIHRELVKNFSISLNFIYRVNKNLHETIDTANPIDGDMWLPYNVTEPGRDGILGTGDDKPITVYALKKEAESPFLYKTNVEGLRRKYWGVEFVMFKRMADNWQLSGSVTYSKSYGNIGGASWDVTGGSGQYTNPNNLINLWGRTTWDRPLIVKLMGTVIFPYGIKASAFYRHISGALFERSGRTAITRTITVYFPEEVQGFTPKVPSVTVLADPHGTYRCKPIDMLDIRVEKEFVLGFGTLGVFVDLFNVLGYDRVWIDKNDGGYLYADGTFKTYPNYGQPQAVLDAARALKLSLRFSF